MCCTIRMAAGNPAGSVLTRLLARRCQLRVKEASNASFVALNDKIVELSREIRIRLATEVRLRHTIAERDNLIRERDSYGNDPHPPKG